MQGGGGPGGAERCGARHSYRAGERGSISLGCTRGVSSGYPAGGHLALLIGSRKHLPKDHPLYSANPLPLAGVVSLAGITDLRKTGTACDSEAIQLMGGGAKEKTVAYDFASPIKLLPLGVK